MKIRGLRWWVVGLVALATVINYVDRQSLNVLYPQAFADIFPDLSDHQHKEIYAFVSMVFVLSYAFGQAAFGKIFDWIGTRIGFVLSIGAWSLATAAHAFAKGVFSFSLFRGILGFAEAGNWPGATKANAEWFPTKERAFAQGIFNSGAAIGGIVSIPLIGFMAVVLEWQLIFIIIGIVGLLWLVPWLMIVKGPPSTHSWLSDEEKAYILSGQHSSNEGDDEPPPSTTQILSKKQSWGIIISSAAIDPIWWIFVFWIPTYLLEVYQMDVKGIAIYGWVPYVGAMLGAWFGGLLAQNRLSSGWSVDATRKLTITLGCLIMLPAFFALTNPVNATETVLTMAVILFGFQTAIGNIQTLPSDFFSGKSVGTLAGFAGMAAKLAAAGLSTSLVPWLTRDGNYSIVFMLGVFLAILAMGSVWVLCGTIRPLKELKTN